jgi:hypothetical protein
MCRTGNIRTYHFSLCVGCDSKLYMFPFLVVRFLNPLVMYLARCSCARLTTINNNQRNGDGDAVAFCKCQRIKRSLFTGRLIEIPCMFCGNTTTEKRLAIQVENSR